MSDKEKTIGEALHRLAVRLLTFPGLVITFFTVSLGIGLFTDHVAAEKFSTLASVYQVIFLGWAVGGIAKRKVDKDAAAKMIVNPK